MASNKSYGLSRDWMELKPRDKNKKQTKGVKREDIEPIYLNTTLSKGECIRHPAEEDDDDDYETLKTVENTTDSSKETDVSKRRADQRRDSRLVPALLEMVILLFVAVAGIGVFLAVEISKEKCTFHFHKALHGEWSTWSQWGLCSVTCDTGIKSRHRTCSNPRPSNGGDFCSGESADYLLCNKASCAAQVASVNGGWANWMTWTECSASCGTGLQHRERRCSNPEPRNGGNQCLGESVEYRLCNKMTCSVTNGEWSNWSSWSSCSLSTCSKTRSRTCTNPSPSAHGLMCPGNSNEKENCDLPACLLLPLQIRLADGTSTQGRLEVSFDGKTWGTVCDDSFSENDAQVACRMLGYSVSEVLNASNVIDGLGPIFLDELGCTGTEASLLYCRHAGWGKEDCTHREDVGVSCS